MKNVLLGLLALLCWLPAQAQQWAWAQGASNCTGRVTEVDSAGNVYVAGAFQGSVQFGSTTLSGGGGFLAKLSPTGTYLWAIRPIGQAEVWHMALGPGGDVYVTAGSNTVVRLSPSGTVRWTTSTTGTTIDGLTVDRQGNAYICGKGLGGAGVLCVARISALGNWDWFVGTTGGGESLGGIAVDSAGNTRIGGIYRSWLGLGSFVINAPTWGRDIVFVASISSTGAWQWAASAGCADVGYCYGVGMDGAGAAYITGHFKHTMYFDSIQVTNNNWQIGDCFVAKISSQGNWEWATHPTNITALVWPYSIKVDQAGGSYISGTYMGSARFGRTNLNAPLTLLSEPFVASLNPDGTWRSALDVAGGTGYDESYGLGLSQTGVLAITGVFQGALLQFGPVRLTNPVANTNSMFVARLDQFAVGVPEGEAGPAFSLLPNPAQGMVALTGLPPTGQVVQVLDVLGREVGHYRSQGETLQLDLRNLPTGLYVVRAGERSRRLVLE